jgi:NifU-like protein involved in Fe-S cluster formation
MNLFFVVEHERETKPNIFEAIEVNFQILLSLSDITTTLTTFQALLPVNSLVQLTKCSHIVEKNIEQKAHQRMKTK